MSQLLLQDRVLDLGLTTFKNEADRFYVCSGLCISYVDATTALSLGFKHLGAGNVLTGPFAGINGRKVTTVPISGGAGTAAGNGGYWAIVDTVNARLLASGTLVASVVIASGVSFNVSSFDITIHNG